jgi:hypothetical protein
LVQAQEVETPCIGFTCGVAAEEKGSLVEANQVGAESKEMVTLTVGNMACPEAMFSGIGSITVGAARGQKMGNSRVSQNLHLEVKDLARSTS